MKRRQQPVIQPRLDGPPFLGSGHVEEGVSVMVGHDSCQMPVTSDALLITGVCRIQRELTGYHDINMVYYYR